MESTKYEIPNNKVIKQIPEASKSNLGDVFINSAIAEILLNLFSFFSKVFM